MNNQSLLLLWVVLAVAGRVSAQSVTPTPLGLYGVPIRWNTHDDWDKLREANLNPVRRSEVLIEWLAQERMHPTPTETGMGGGPIDSSYLQAQIVKVLAEWGDPLAVQWVANAPQVMDEGMRDAMFLALGRMGDIRQTPNLMRILANDTLPDYRALAAEALGGLGAVKALPLLKRMQFDNFAVSFESHNDIGPPERFITVRPVRGAVRYALQVLQSPADLQEAKTLQQQFVRQMAVSRKYARTHHLSPARFIAAANRGRP